jgi:hypothetical protein
MSDEVTVETLRLSIERDKAGWTFLRDAIHNVGPVPDLVRETLGLRWSPVHHIAGDPVHRPVGERVPVEPLALCARCGRGMNPGDAMCAHPEPGDQS